MFVIKGSNAAGELVTGEVRWQSLLQRRRLQSKKGVDCFLREVSSAR
jgi:hypothetical protein